MIRSPDVLPTSPHRSSSTRTTKEDRSPKPGEAGVPASLSPARLSAIEFEPDGTQTTEKPLPKPRLRRHKSCRPCETARATSCRDSVLRHATAHREARRAPP